MMVRPLLVVLAMVSVAGAAAPAAARQTEATAGPTFTPFTQKPELRSAQETRDLLRAMYPPLLREAGISGTATYWLFIDRTGKIGKVQLERSSGYEELDAAAARVAEQMRFTPALNRDRRVDVWLKLPIAFRADDAGASRRLPDRGQERARAGSGDITAAPAFTPYTEAPTLANRAEVANALQASYPPLLRDAGIGGTASVWFLIDEDGEVVKTQVARSSGQDALDQAALSVAGAMRFHPARNRGEEVMVWVQVPVTFASK